MQPTYQPTYQPTARARRLPPQHRTAPAAPQAEAGGATGPARSERAQEGPGGRRTHCRLSWPAACIGLLGLAVSYMAVRLAAPPQQAQVSEPGTLPRRSGAETDPAWTSEPASRSLAERDASIATPAEAESRPTKAAPDTKSSVQTPSQQLAQRIAAISREPIDLNASPLDDALLDAHTLPVAHALRKLIVDTADDRADITLTQRQASEAAKLSEITDIILHTQYSDPRWKYLIATNLRYAYQGEGSGIHLEPGRWDEIIKDRFFAQVEWIPDFAPDGRPGHKMAALDHWAYHCFIAKDIKPLLGADAFWLAKERQGQPRVQHPTAGCDAPNVRPKTVAEAGVQQDRPID